MQRRAARTSLLAFTEYTNPRYFPDETHETIAAHLERVERGETKRLMLLVAPRFGKSELASRRAPAWMLGRNPRLDIICASAGGDLAADFGRDVRNLVASLAYQELFATRLAEDSQAKGRWSTQDGGSYYAVGVGGAILGRGGNVFVVDDPFPTWEAAQSDGERKRVIDWYGGTVLNRLEPGAALVLINHRMHPGDLSGHLLQQDGAERWTVVEVPALDEDDESACPTRWSTAELLTKKAEMPDAVWSAMYMQRPTIEGGSIIKSAWWKRWTKPKLPPLDLILQVYDTAMTEGAKSDYSARTTWGLFLTEDDDDPHMILLERWMDKVGFPELRESAIDDYNERLKDKIPMAVVIEAANNGFSLQQEFRRVGIPARLYNPRTMGGTKTTRAHLVSPLFKAGRIWAPAYKAVGETARDPERYQPWAQDLIDRCAAFPQLEHDDDVDTVTAAVSLARNWADLLHPQDERPEYIEPPKALNPYSEV